MTYIAPDVIDDETAVAEGILAALADRIDGFQPSEGHIETPLAESVAVAVATAVTVLKDTVLDAYIGFAQQILAIPRGPAGVATAVSTWTIDTTQVPAGMVISAGTEVQATLPTGDHAAFIVSQDETVAAGLTTKTGVVIVAVEAGPDSNGASNPATSTDLVGVLGVSIDVPAAGGADEEELDAYVDRATDRAQRLHAMPISTSDYAAFATDVTGVVRAAAVNNLDPGAPGVTSLGHVTLYLVDSAGHPLSAPVKTAVNAYFAQIDRPLNVTLHLADPAYVNVTVAATVRADVGVDHGDLQSRAAAAITDLLSDATWDADTSAPGGWAAPRATQLTVFDVAGALDDLDGLAAVSAVTINGAVTPVALGTPLSLPNLTATPTVTVT